MCGADNGGCEQICEVTENDEEECLCYRGFILSDDGYTCLGV